MADETKQFPRRHIVHKHTTKGRNLIDEEILREKLEVGEIALNVGKDRPSLVFFAQHTPVSPHDTDTNFDKMIELKPSPYVITSASTDNVKPEITEDHTQLDPYSIGGFTAKLSDEYEALSSPVQLAPGTTMDEAIGELDYEINALDGRIDNLEGEHFATINNTTVRGTTAFSAGTINGTPIVTKNTKANVFNFAKINGSAVTYANTTAKDITIPMTTVSAGDAINITLGQDGIDHRISFAGLVGTTNQTIEHSDHNFTNPVTGGTYITGIELSGNTFKLTPAEDTAVHHEVVVISSGGAGNIVTSVAKAGNSAGDHNLVVTRKNLEARITGDTVGVITDAQFSDTTLNMTRKKSSVQVESFANNGTLIELPGKSGVVALVSDIEMALSSGVNYKGTTRSLPTSAKTGDLYIVVVEEGMYIPADKSATMNEQWAEYNDFIIAAPDASTGQWNGRWDVIQKNIDGIITVKANEDLDPEYIVISDGGKVVKTENLYLSGGNLYIDNRKFITEADMGDVMGIIEDNELVTAAALNDLNDRKQNLSERVTVINSASTNNEYPTAKAVYTSVNSAVSYVVATETPVSAGTAGSGVVTGVTLSGTKNHTITLNRTAAVKVNSATTTVSATTSVSAVTSNSAATLYKKLNIYQNGTSVASFDGSAVASALTTDTMIKEASANTKAYLIGHATVGSTATGITNNKVFMSGGSIFVNNNEVVTKSSESQITVTNSGSTNTAAQSAVYGVVTGGTKGHELTLQRTNKIHSATTANSAVTSVSATTSVSALTSNSAITATSATTAISAITATSAKTSYSAVTATSATTVISAITAMSATTVISAPKTDGTLRLYQNGALVKSFNGASTVSAFTSDSATTYDGHFAPTSANSPTTVTGARLTGITYDGKGHVLSISTASTDNVDTKVTDANSNAKSFLLGHATQGTSATAQTNSKVYMSGGTIFIDGIRVAVITDIDSALAGSVNYKGATSTVPSSSSTGDLWIAAGVITLTSAQSATGAAQTAETGDFIIARSTGKWDVIQKNMDGAVTTTATTLTDGNVIVGKGNQTIGVSSYTIAKSVPSTAVFTDTATTYNGHYSPAKDSTSARTQGARITGITIDGKGHVVAVSSAATDNTDTATTYSGHYTPAKDSSSARTQGARITGITIDGKGHVVAISSAATDNTDTATTETGHYAPSTSANTVGSATDGRFIKQIQIDSKKHVISVSTGTALTSTSIKVNSASTSDSAITATSAKTSYSAVTAFSATTSVSAITSNSANSLTHSLTIQQNGSDLIVWNGSGNGVVNIVGEAIADNKVQNKSGNTKVYLLGQDTIGATSSAMTNPKVFMSGGTIFVNNNEVMTNGNETAIAVTNSGSTNTAAQSVVYGVVTGGTKGHSLTLQRTNKVYSASTSDSAITATSAKTSYSAVTATSATTVISAPKTEGTLRVYNNGTLLTSFNGSTTVSALTLDTMIKESSANTKAFLIGHATTGTTATGITNSKVFMSGGTIFINNKEIAVKDDAVDEKIKETSANTKAFLIGHASTGSTASGITNNKVYMSGGTIFINGKEIATKEYADSADEKIKETTATTKAFLIGHASTGSTASGITHNNVYMSGGTIFINGKEIATKEYADNADTKVANANGTGKAFLLGQTAQTTTATAISNASVYMSGGSLYAASMFASQGFYQTSDERLKNFGDDVQVDFNKLFSLPKKYFTWKEDAEAGRRIGTSAQELKKTYPELVTEDEDGYLAVDYASLSVIALAAIDKLHEENETLKKRIESIEKYLTDKNK